MTKGLGKYAQQHTAEDDAGDVAHAAQDHHAQDHDGFEQAEALRRNELLKAGEQTAGDTAEAGAHGEGEQLDIARVDAHRRSRNLILAYRHPRAADARIFQTARNENYQ